MEGAALGGEMVVILLVGGLGMVVGLALFGSRMLCAMGVKLCAITPSRGFSIELGAMLVVLLGSRLGIPLSTTHCQVGATVGVAATEGRLSAVNWPAIRRICWGWVFTMVVNGALTAALFAIGLFAIEWDPAQQLPPWLARARTGSAALT
jgi:sodium-dependent phosphate transporter